MRFVPLAAVCASALAAPLALAETPDQPRPVTPEEVLSERGLKGTVTLDMLPVPPAGILALGAEVWAGRCTACHSHKNATGAPKITSQKAWTSRIEQGLPVLFDHAIGGFMGPRYLEMPPRGGDPDLSDQQVKAAVAFMVWASGGADIANAWINTQSLHKETPE